MKTILLNLSLLLFLTFALHAQDAKKVIEKERNVQAFTQVHVETGIDVYITPGNAQKLVVKADENVIDHILTEVHDGALHIHLEKRIRNSKTLEVHLTTTPLTHIEAQSGSDVYSTQALDWRTLNLRASGGSDVHLELNVKTLECHLSGGADAVLSGKVGQLNLLTTGGSDFKGKNLDCAKAKVKASGGSDAWVSAADEISMEASGASDIFFKGKAKVLHQKASGSSDIHTN